MSENGNAFVEAFKTGFLLVNDVRKQRLEQQKVDQEKQIANQTAAIKLHEQDIQAAHNSMTSATEVLKNPDVPVGTKINLYNSNVKPYFQKYVGQGLPEIKDWNELGDQFFTKVNNILGMKSVSQGDKQMMLGQLALEQSGSLKNYMETAKDALNQEKQPSVEQKQYSLLTPEEQRKSAITKFNLNPNSNLDIRQIPFGGDQVAEVVIDKDSFNPKTGAIKSYVLSIGGKQAIGSKDKTILEKGLPSETGGKLALVVEAMDQVDNTITPLMFPNGVLDRASIIEAKTGSTPKGRRLVSALSTLRAAILRPETGAAAPTPEQKDVASRLEPSVFFDNTESARANLDAAMNQLTGFAAVTDPEHKYRDVIRKEQAARKEKSLSKSSVSTEDLIKALKNAYSEGGNK